MMEDSAKPRSPVTALEEFEGTGQLRCQHGKTRDCKFVIIRLLNGRLQVRVHLDVRHRSSEAQSQWLKKCEPFAVEGQDDRGIRLSAANIHFTRTILSLADDKDTLVGYAESAVRRGRREPVDTVTIECELSNFRASSPAYPVRARVDSREIEIGRLSWQGWGGIDEHSNAYRHAAISAYLRLHDVGPGDEDEAIECLQRIATLLSVAGRGHVFLAARHRFAADKQWCESQYSEPVFTARGWLRPLIQGESLGEFLVTAYPQLTARHRSFELGNVIDHYLQALTLYSAWPLSLGIFTAMEALRAAFFRRPENEAEQFWVPPKELQPNGPTVEYLMAVLRDHFPRFGKLTRAESESLRGQLAGINRRSYRHQLQTMFDRLRVKYSPKELHPFVDIRNTIIHQGVPAEGTADPDEYERGTAKGWKRIRAAGSLFERALLAVLGYSGPCELFDASEGED